MKEIIYEQFFDPTEEFYKNEVRACCYDISMDLIKEAKKEDPTHWYISDKTIDAIVNLLFCWNYATPITKNLKKKDIKKLLENSQKLLRRLENKNILDFNEEDEGIISTVFEEFKNVMGQTGATKALSLLNWKLFVMWDTEIRKRLRKEIIRGISNGEKPKHYVKFLKGIKDIIHEYHIDKKVNSDSSLAKKIDEFHYLGVVMGGKNP